MNLKFFLQKSITLALDILFPPICLACNTTLSPEEKKRSCCVRCFDSILIGTGFSCPTCGARLPTIADQCHDGHPYTLAAATQFSDPAVRRLIYTLKYNRVRGAATPLAEILATHLNTLQLDLASYILVPLPLHHARERERGFNQSEIIAQQVGATFAIPLIARVLQRVRATEPQASIKAANNDGLLAQLIAWLFRNKKSSRATNVADCFAVSDPTLIRGRRVLLVDDVTTSGNTLREATRALRSAGARSVVALVVARAR